MSLKNNYDEILKSLQEFKERLDDLLPYLPGTKDIYTRKMDLKRRWERSKDLINELGALILPVQSLPVEIPSNYNNPDFIQTWTFYKEYLEEQHGISMKSRMEIKNLKRLVEISENNPEVAIKFLEYAISKGSKGFYKVDDKTKTKSYDPDFN
jgi:hypothetical protein